MNRQAGKPDDKDSKDDAVRRVSGRSNGSFVYVNLLVDVKP
jgi:hypothetical protein